MADVLELEEGLERAVATHPMTASVATSTEDLPQARVSVPLPRAAMPPQLPPAGPAAAPRGSRQSSLPPASASRSEGDGEDGAHWPEFGGGDAQGLAEEAAAAPEDEGDDQYGYVDAYGGEEGEAQGRYDYSQYPPWVYDYQTGEWLDASEGMPEE